MTKNITLIGIMILFLNACQVNQHKVSIIDKTFIVEVADDHNSRTQGLMYRKSMPEDEGMLFIFPENRSLGFWMQNTLIPLDILYFDQNKSLINIIKNAPPCKNTITRCPNYPSHRPAKYVLEINGGLSEKYGFKPGDKIIFDLKK